MPLQKKVHGSWLVVNSHKKTINHQPSTINRNSTGFTLVELLVVIAILGILASFTSIVLIGHLKQARDAQRKSDLNIFKKAMESVKNDCQAAAYYPWGAGNESGRFNAIRNYLLDSDLNYLSSSLQDPVNTSSAGAYYTYRLVEYNNIGNYCPSSATPPVKNSFTATDMYVLRVQLENSSDPNLTTSYNQCSATITAINTRAGMDIFTPNITGTPDGLFYVCSSPN